MKRGWKIAIYVLSGILLLVLAVFAFRYPLLEWLLVKQMAKRQVPGVSVALIEKNEVKWTKSYGVIKADTTHPVTADTLFQAASVTKLLVASLALHFVEKGVLDLDKDINNFLTSWQLPDNEFTIEKKVTLRLLLSHRSGLPDSDFSYLKDSAPSLIQVLKGESPAQNQSALVEFVPGSRWHYSNLGYVLVQLVLEDVCGQSIEQIMNQVIFKPLGMNNSTLVYPLSHKFADRSEALPHDEKGNAHPANLHPTAVAQGGLLSTPGDIAKLMIELMRSYQGESERVISKAMVLQMFHEEIALDAKHFGGIPASQGLGVFIVKGNKFYLLSVGNNAPGSSCWAAGIPQSGQGAVVMTNGSQGFDLSTQIIGALLMANFWPMPDL
jgi:CubicO group peptidase (beta-lactamase class C family)